jgi:tRNA threonylcarbamoyladenosine biosynthesis protein TsaE
MKPDSLTLHLACEAETSALVKTFAPFCRRGGVILLKGEIGAGKSFFSRALILELLEIPEDIPSPTFTIVQTYTAPDLEIWHCDLYRLTSPDEAFELGLEDAFETALCLIEWPEKLAGVTPSDALTMTFQHTDSDTARNVTLNSAATKWHPLYEALDAR